MAAISGTINGKAAMRDLKIHIQTGAGANGLGMTLIDQRSGLVILRTRLTHEQLGKAVMGFTTESLFDAQVVEPTQVAYLGKEGHYFRRHFRYTDQAVPEFLRKGDIPPALVAWAEEVQTRCWAHQTSWRINNNRTVIFGMTRYDNELTEERATEVQECLDSRPSPKGLA